MSQAKGCHACYQVFQVSHSLSLRHYFGRELFVPVKAFIAVSYGVKQSLSAIWVYVKSPKCGCSCYSKLKQFQCNIYQVGDKS